MELKQLLVDKKWKIAYGNNNMMITETYGHREDFFRFSSKAKCWIQWGDSYHLIAS